MACVVHGVAKSWTQLSVFPFHNNMRLQINSSLVVANRSRKKDFPLLHWLEGSFLSEEVQIWMAMHFKKELLQLHEKNGDNKSIGENGTFEWTCSKTKEDDFPPLLPFCCICTGGAERSYARSKVRGSGREELPRVRGQGRWPRGATPRPMSGAAVERNNPTSKVRKGGSEEIPLVQGKEQWLHFAGAAVKRYPMSKVRKTQERR